MKRLLSQLAIGGVIALGGASGALAGTVIGVVRNGTTGALAAGVEVVLIQLQGSMEAVANTKTDAQGRYRFEHSVLGRQPMLIRVNYRGVNFHQSLPPGRDVVDVEVFEPTVDASAVQVASRLIAVQPSGSVLLVGEEYTVQNHSNPPKAYYKPEGNFTFQIPAGGELAQVSAWGPSGMPVVQGTIDRGDHRYAVAFAFRPGESGVRLSYHIPYDSNRAVLHLPSSYAARRVMVVAPPTIEISSAGLVPAGTEQGWSVYARDAVPADAAFDLSISGTAPPPSASEAQGLNEAQARDSGRAEGPARVLPSRLDSLKWVLIGGFAALFFLGAMFLWRRPAVAPVAVSAAPMGSNSERPARSRRTAARAAQAGQELDREVGRSLDELKDWLFRLELRRQAGTLSEEEYARERGRAEKVLRDLLKG